MAIRISGDEHLWPDGIVPFEIDETTIRRAHPGEAVILAAIAEWNSKTNVTFIKRTFEDDYIVFHFGDNETTSTARSAGRAAHRRSTAPRSASAAAAIIHEIGHASGCSTSRPAGSG
jgi:hypothetical protein